MQSKYHHIQNKILIKIKVSSNKKSLNKIKYQDIVKSQSCQIKISPTGNFSQGSTYETLACTIVIFYESVYK